jgi:hypothetical protein
MGLQHRAQSVSTWNNESNTSLGGKGISSAVTFVALLLASLQKSQLPLTSREMSGVSSMVPDVPDHLL